MSNQAGAHPGSRCNAQGGKLAQHFPELFVVNLATAIGVKLLEKRIDIDG
jgi:hypothetical protein